MYGKLCIGEQMMKSIKNNRIEYRNNNYGERKMLRRRQVRRRMIMCLLVFVVALTSALSVGHKAVSGKKINNKKIGKEENVSIKKSSLKADNTKLELLNPIIQTEKKQYTIDPDKPMVALTFDDGPGLRTMELLNALEEYEARATFFTCGTSLKRNDIDVENVLKTMKNIGCEICNHTMEHRELSKLSKREIISQVKGVNKILKNYIGEDAELLRPPYGDGIHNKKVTNNVGLPMIYWSIDTLDWKTRSKKQTVKEVMKNVQDGDIVLMHDIHTWSVDAAIEIIPKLIKKGYQLVTVSEMAQARGVELENGKTYFDFRP